MADPPLPPKWVTSFMNLYILFTDVNVDLFLSRDLDSRISVREVAAVHEFIQSDYLMHVSIFFLFLFDVHFCYQFFYFFRL